MIITRSWLSEFIDLKNISSEQICEKLNSIGLEVDSLNKIDIAKSIVVGKVLECDRHPNADKLSVCKVDIGSKIEQIVCGAKNVAKGLLVPVATVGTVMPNGLEIKPIKLRDVDSSGMICSSEELGFPKTNDGILELDNSIGDLVLGKSLCEYEVLNDDIIEIELTANRGDCLSIYGVARELSTAFNLELEEINDYVQDESNLGIGRILSIHSSSDKSALLYSVLDFRNLTDKVKINLRLAVVDELKDGTLDNALMYSTYTTGVIFRAYRHQNEKSEIEIKSDESGFDSVYLNGSKISTIGINADDDARANYGKTIIEASYINPETISREMFEAKQKSIKVESDDLFYRTSRGSEPNLTRGFNFLYNLLNIEFKNDDILMYSGSSEISCEQNEVVLSISNSKITNIIGQEIDSSKSVSILKSLGFRVNIDLEDDNLIVNVPEFRHDIVSGQDIVEEIVRIVGIDNIDSKPFSFSEKNKLDSGFYQYKNRKSIRMRAVSNGFFENISYVFTKRENLLKYNLEVVDEKLDILNPIVKELDTLRSTIVLNLIESASKNINLGKKSIRLFEIGSTFNKDREESLKIAFLFSGQIEQESFINGGKPENIDFYKFADKLSNVIGDFELEELVDSDNALIHPYQSANIYMNGKNVGYISKLHLDVAKEFDLSDTFVAELDFEAINFDLIEAKDFSKFQAVHRDLSLVIDSELKFRVIKAEIEKLNLELVKEFFVFDIYSDEKLGDKMSLTIRFNLQSSEKTLEEADITKTMDSILEHLEKTLQIGLRWVRQRFLKPKVLI